MRLLVTRPDEDAAPLMAALEAMGHEAVHAPLLTVRHLPDAVVPDEAWAGLLVTSANGVRALTARAFFSDFLSVPVFAVGDASAAAARAAGFRHVVSAAGDVASLAELVVRQAPAGPLLHVAGTVVAGDLAGLLAAQGFRVHRAVLYEAVAADHLPDAVVVALKAGNFDGILIFSPRTGAVLKRLIEAAGLQALLEDLTAYCLSQAVADALRGLPFGRVVVAAEPRQEALLALIEK
ncbi:MAG: uroporphyrinogen-III synthase [Parvibaculum sp.]|nr:uroporphyrinogen-III synthase [Parvibaculum sp.]